MPRLTLDYPKAMIPMEIATEIEAAWRVRACAKEPWTVAWIERMGPKDVLYDVGANVGSYSLLAAHLGRSVVAFEPGEANFNALLQNMHIQPPTIGARILALNAALGATDGPITFKQAPHPGFGEGGEVERQIPQVRLDGLLMGSSLPAPTHLKIDVDGHELAVLTGAEWCLRQGPMKSVLVEVTRSLGPRVRDQMAMFGWQVTATYDTRNGTPIKSCVYDEFIRAPQLAPLVPVMLPVQEHAEVA